MIEKLFSIDGKSFIKLVYRKSKEVDLFVNAMSLVYTTLLSIIPVLIFSFYLLTLFNFGGLSDLIARLKLAILNNLATGTGHEVINYLEQHVTNIDINQLGAISFFSLVMVVIFLLARVERTFNKIWGISQHRDLFTRFVYFWTLITLGTFLATLSLSLALAVGSMYLGNLPIGQNMIFRVVSVVSYFIIFFLAYYLIPNTEVEVLAALVGGLTSGLLFQLARNLYTFYTTHIVGYNQIYGSLAAVPLFLVWLYLIWVISLLGAVVSYVFQHRKNLYYFTDLEEITLEIRVLIPLAILVILYKKFISKGETGVILKELIERINLPSPVIEEELDRLQAEDLIAATKDGKYILASSAPDIPIWQVCKEAIVEKDLDITQVFCDREVWQVYELLQSNLEDNFAQLTIADLLKD
ncbi:YhjD/YihY/BrkB family envelope integrity protein [Halanaerobaculum tunisiense]